MAKTITIATRAQWAAYLQREAEKMAALTSERDNLRELVEDAYRFRERMPKGWTARAQLALKQ